MEQPVPAPLQVAMSVQRILKRTGHRILSLVPSMFPNRNRSTALCDSAPARLHAPPLTATSFRPNLLRLTLDRRCRRILALDPIARVAGAVARGLALRHDAPRNLLPLTRCSTIAVHESAPLRRAFLTKTVAGTTQPTDQHAGNPSLGHEANDMSDCGALMHTLCRS